MFAATLLWLAASSAPKDYRQPNLTPDDVASISTLCHMTTRSKSELTVCLKAQTDKLVASKQIEIDGRSAEQQTLQEIGR